MKYIDLNDQKHRQVIVDKEKDVYLGQLSSVMLEDNKTIIAVYPKGGHGRGSTVMKKSVDGGLTWSDRIKLPESFVTALEVPTIYRLTDANENKRLVFFTGFYPIRAAVSEDDGNTWSDLKSIGDFCGICAMGDILTGENPGEYIALFHDDKDSCHTDEGGTRHEFWKHTKDNHQKYIRKIFKQSKDGTFALEQTLFVDGDADIPEENGTKIYEAYFNNMDCGKGLEIKKTITRDGGLTWSEPQSVISHETAALCEPGTIKLKDGTIAVLMRDNTHKLNSFIMFSHDNGKTFTDLRELPTVLTGDRHICRRLNDGRIAITFRDRVATNETLGDWILWVGTDEDLLLNRDGEYRFRLKDCINWDCAYAGLHVLPDDTIVAISYGHWEEDEKPYILSVRLNLNEF